MASVLEGEKKIKPNDFASFLYPHDAVFDPGDPEDGLLRGVVPVRVSDSATLIFFHFTFTCFFAVLPPNFHQQ